jgi:nitrilase
MTQDPFTVAAIQLASGTNLQANLLEAERETESAVRAGAQVVVLPENFGYMGDSNHDIPRIKESDGRGPLQDFLAHLAQRLGIWVVGGTVPLEARDPSKARAACLVYDDQGRRAARYDKIHLFDVELLQNGEKYEESASFEPGQKVVVTDTPFGRLGLAVCYDLRFPELFRGLVNQGAEWIAMPAAFTAVTGKAHWETLVRARAIENLVHLVAAAQGGFHVNGRETYGHSMIIDPWGRVLAEHERGSGFAAAALDRQFARKMRLSFPCLAHRRL